MSCRLLRQATSIGSDQGPRYSGYRRSGVTARLLPASALRFCVAQLDDQIGLGAEPDIAVGCDAAEGLAKGGCLAVLERSQWSTCFTQFSEPRRHRPGRAMKNLGRILCSTARSGRLDWPPDAHRDASGPAGSAHPRRRPTQAPALASREGVILRLQATAMASDQKHRDTCAELRLLHPWPRMRTDCRAEPRSLPLVHLKLPAAGETPAFPFFFPE